jgi:GNAT superfamily N-acetyltransferase
MSGEHEVTTWYLEMPTRSALVPARTPAWEHRLERARRPSAAFARYLYTAVGGDWHWTDRLTWSKARWDAFLLREAYELYTLQLGGAPAGFAELERQPDGNAQLIYLGLMPEAMGRGFGGRLLSYTVERAWEPTETERVWVHTCTLDAPAALPNYQARGFSLFRTETKAVPLTAAPGPWPGWQRDGGA